MDACKCTLLPSHHCLLLLWTTTLCIFVKLCSTSKISSVQGSAVSYLAAFAVLICTEATLDFTKAATFTAG